MLAIKDSTCAEQYNKKSIEKFDRLAPEDIQPGDLVLIK